MREPTAYRCPLGRLVPSMPDFESIRREGWREQRILVIATSDPRLTWVDREFIEQIGEKLYGAGRKKQNANKR